MQDSTHSRTKIGEQVSAHRWFQDLATGRARNTAAIAAREGVNKSYVNRVVELAFLAPEITENIMAGRQPEHLSVEQLTKHMDLPIDWADQRQLLRFA